MDGLGLYITIGFFMVLVIEGLFYSLFPTQIQNIMKIASDMNSEKFRHFGGLMFASGVIGIFLIQKFFN